MNNFKKVLFALISLSFAAGMYSCSPASPKLKAKPEFVSDKMDVIGDSVSAKPVVDMLFVVDNSGSMDTHQRNLANNIQVFLNSFAKLKVDYHVGVISTDMDNRIGELLGKTKFVTEATPNGLAVLKSNLLLGTNGSATEAVFDPIMAALSPAFIAPTGKNGGFIRDSAYLVVILITDAEDQSRRSTSTKTLDYLVNLKGGDARKVLSYGAIVPVNDPFGCSRDEGAPYDIEAFLRGTVNTAGGKNIMNLCDPAFGQSLANFSKDLSRYLSGVIKLNRPPIVSTIKVTFGTQTIPPDFKTGWYYDPKENAVILGEDVAMDENQPDGTAVKVTYDSAKFPEEEN